MNDAELDELIAATASVRDTDVARWDRGDDDLCEEIMSMPTIELPERTTDDQATAPSARPDRHYRWRRLVAAAAVAFVVAIAAAIAGTGSQPGDPSQPRPTDTVTIASALAQSSSVLQGTARAEARTQGEYAHAEGDPEVPGEVFDYGSFLWEFSGEDFRFIRGEEVAVRVGGEEYAWGRYGATEEFTWLHRAQLTGLTDVRTVIGEIRSTSTFTEVGTEPVDGVTTRRLRATDPASTVSPETVYPISGVLRAGSSITEVEIWIGDDDIVRRLDFTTVDDSGCDDPAACPRYTETTSIHFYDIGAPMTIEAPTDYQEEAAPQS